MILRRKKICEKLCIHFPFRTITGFTEFYGYPIIQTYIIVWNINIITVCTILTFSTLIFNFFLYFTDRNFVIANAQIETYPIIFCNDGFCELTGFSRAEVMQKSCLCEFLHCSSTSTYSVLQIKEALQGTEEKQVEIMYSRKDGKG